MCGCLHFKSINLTVGEGEMVALIGTSGVGKVSYMLQKDLLLEHKTILKNVALPLIIKGIKKSVAYDEARQLLERFGLLDYQDRYPQELSGGMRQRVALLRTYLFKHKLFLLDEAFSALDALTKAELYSWHLAAQKELGLSTLLITHDIDEAILLSDQIYILKHRPGQLVAEVVIERNEGQLTSDQQAAYKTTMRPLRTGRVD